MNFWDTLKAFIRNRLERQPEQTRRSSVEQSRIAAIFSTPKKRIKMRVSFYSAMIISALLIMAGSSFADRSQSKCPVMGGDINKEVYADYQGSRVYFCCPGCKEPFLAKPDSFLTKMKEGGVVLEKTPNQQTHCPVMGGEINREVFTDHNGKRIFFCCKDCQGKFKAAPESFLKKLKEQGVNLEDAPSLKH
jgi:YHS domain-containing protein